MQRFEAPWCGLLKVVTVVVSVILLGIGCIIALQVPSSQPVVRALIMLAPFAGIGLAGVFMVRWYEVGSDVVKIKRLGWSNWLDLRELTDARVDPEALRRSLRLFGNGGFFSFTGWFRSKSLGVYRFYGTDPERAVVLKFANERTVVLTPDRPEEFVRLLTSRMAGRAEAL